MKLSDKIRELRKTHALSQEQLAEICGVSRQAISKWEADIALPETDKLLVLSNTFRVPVDTLLRDELPLTSATEAHACGRQCGLLPEDARRYTGVIIKESVEDEDIFDYMSVTDAEFWKTQSKPRYWTALSFASGTADLPQRISKALKDGTQDTNWFCDFNEGNVKYLVFKDLVLSYPIGDAEQKEQVKAKCREMGIPDEQMDWSE